MPLQLFIVLVFGIFGFLSVGLLEPLMRNFAAEADLSTWLFIAVPGLFAMLIALFVFHRAEHRVIGVRDALTSEGGEVLGGTSAQFATFLRAEHAKWAKIVRDSGARLD